MLLMCSMLPRIWVRALGGGGQGPHVRSARGSAQGGQAGQRQQYQHAAGDGVLTPRGTTMISLSTTKTYRRSAGFSGTGPKLCDLHHMAGDVAEVRIEPIGQSWRLDRVVVFQLPAECLQGVMKP